MLHRENLMFGFGSPRRSASPLWQAVRAVKAVKLPGYTAALASEEHRLVEPLLAITQLCELFDGLPELPELLRVGVAVVALAFPSLSLHIAREWELIYWILAT
jgi:hypothetical protein